MQPRRSGSDSAKPRYEHFAYSAFQIAAPHLLYDDVRGLDFRIMVVAKGEVAVHNQRIQQGRILVQHNFHALGNEYIVSILRKLVLPIRISSFPRGQLRP